MRKLISYRSSVLFIVAAFTVIAVACARTDSGGSAETTASPPAATVTTSVPTATATANAIAPATSLPALPGDSASGAKLFVSQSCSACHSTGDRVLVGPGLKGVGDRAAMRGGDAYLFESIKDSDAVVVEGFKALMPDYSRLNDQVVADLVAYLKTLK